MSSRVFLNNEGQVVVVDARTKARQVLHRITITTFITHSITDTAGFKLSNCTILCDVTRDTAHSPAVQAGFQVSGWKSLIDKQSRSLGLNLPDGVIIITEGGAKG